MAEGKAGGGGASLRTATGDKGFATKLLMQQYGGTLFIIVYTHVRVGSGFVLNPHLFCPLRRWNSLWGTASSYWHPRGYLAGVSPLPHPNITYRLAILRSTPAPPHPLLIF
jgi:hypothetical protein